MLTRKIMDKLLEWKRSEKKKCLLIDGARQVGKTFIIRKFGEQYDNYIELNFLEHPEYMSIFSGSLDVNSLIIGITALVPDANITAHGTLILLDEIQECPAAITSLKFWSLDGRFDVVATGSALGIDYKRKSSYPVGFVETVPMTSLDFEEFLWAVGTSQSVIDAAGECFAKRIPVPEAVHIHLQSCLKQYLITGGMPETVKEYSSGHNLKTTDAMQRQIYSDYISDIARYAPPEVKIKAEKCYRSIPNQLTKENHKFQYRVVENRGSASKYETSIDWLERAHIAKSVYNVSAVDFPISTFIDMDNFRLYPTDIGLLMAAYPYLVKTALLDDAKLEAPANNMVIGTAKGGIYEALAADMLIKRGYTELMFLKDAKSTREVEFFITNDDGIIPVEIKAGRNKANSLGHLLEKEIIPYGYKMSSQNVGVSGKLITLPLYMLMFV